MMNPLKEAESFRREQPSMSTLPLNREERERIAAISAHEATTIGDVEYLIDYASAGHKIASGQHILDESLIAGQKQRSELAYRAIAQGLRELRLWMLARGYDV